MTAISDQVSGVRFQGKAQEKAMKKTFVVPTLCAMLFALCVPAQAQQPSKIPRIGYLTQASLSAVSARTDALRQGLRDLGYIEGKNIAIEWRAADGNRERAQALAVELVRLKGRSDRYWR